MRFASLLALLVQAVLSLDTAWLTPLPTGMQLINGDWISIAVDDYVNVKGARFSAMQGSSDITSTSITPKIKYQVSQLGLPNGVFTQYPCTIMVPLSNNVYAFLCLERFVFKVPLTPSFELGTSPSFSRIEITGDTKTVCTDMKALTNNFLTFICHNTTSGVNNPFFFAFDTSTAWPADLSQVNQLAYTPKNGSSQMTQITIDNTAVYLRMDVMETATSGQFAFAIWNALPNTATTAPTADTSSFWHCVGMIQLSQVNLNPCTLVKLSTIYGLSADFPSSVRGVKGVVVNSATDLGWLVVAASGNSTTKSVSIGVVNLDGTYNPKNKDASSPFKNLYTVPITNWAPGSDANSMLAFSFVGYKPNAADLTNIVLVDRLNIVYIGIQATIVSTIYQFAEASPATTWSSPFECKMNTQVGVAAFPARVHTMGKLVSALDSRIVVEYRAVGGTYREIVGVAINFNYTKYGCWQETINPAGIFLWGFNKLISQANENLVVSLLSPDTLLRVQAVNTSPGVVNNTITVKANTDGSQATPVTSALTYGVGSKAEDFNTLSLTQNSIKAYPNTKFWLPFSPSAFNSNAPTIKVDTTSANNVIVGYTQNSKPIKDIIDPDGKVLTLKRVFPIDKDWAVAVYSVSTDTSRDYFALIKVPYENGVAFFNPDSLFKANLDPMPSAKYIYKAFKVVDSFCLIGFSHTQGATYRAFLNCYRLSPKVSGTSYENSFSVASPGLTGSNIEPVTAHPIVLGNIVHILIILNDGSKNVIKDWSFSVTSTTAGGITTNVFSAISSPTDVNFQTANDDLIKDYYPIDIMPEFWGDGENTNLITIRMYKKMSPPVVVRYNLIINGASLSLNRVRVMRLEGTDLNFCPMRDELIFYSPRSRQIYSQRWDRLNILSKGESKYYFPLTEYGVQSIIQFSCITEKGFFQILAKATIANVRKNLLITFRGGETMVGGRRVFSIQEVATDVDYISTTSDKDFLYTWATTPTASSPNRLIVQTSIRGPTFYVDTQGKTDKWDIIVNQTSRKVNDPGVTSTFSVFITQPVTVATVKPKEAFNLDVGSTIMLDEKCDITGPVTDITKSGDDAGPPNGPLITLNPRITGNMNYQVGTPSTYPNKIVVEGVVEGHLFAQSSIVQILVDPIGVRSNPRATNAHMLHEITNAVDVTIVNTTIEGVAIAIVKTSQAANDYKYSIYHVTYALGQATTTSAIISTNVYSTSINYMMMQGTWIKDWGLAMAISSDVDFVSNNIRLVSFKYDATAKSFAKQSEASVIPGASRELGAFALVSYFDGSNAANPVRRATVIGRYNGFAGFAVAHWDLSTMTTQMITSDAVVRVSDTASDNVLVNFNYMRCWNRFDKDKTTSCYLDVYGINDYYVDITFKPASADGTEPLESVVKVFEFVMPPKYSAIKVDRAANYFAMLLDRNEPFASSVAQVFKYDDCQRLIAVYKPVPTNQNFIHSTVLCSSFGTYTENKVDFAMESFSGSAAGEYLFYANAIDGAATKVKVDKVGSSSVTIKMAIPDPSKITLNFIGLGGVNDKNNPSIALGELKKGAEPEPSSSTWWIWLLVILAIIGVAVGGYFAWVWYQNQSSSGTTGMSSSSYRKPEDNNTSANNTSSDLLDERL